MASDATWADCASAFASYDAVGGGARGTLAFDVALARPLKSGRAFSPVSFDGDGGAPLSSIEFASQGAKGGPSGAAPGSVFAATSVPAIPEPHTNLLMLAGLAAIAFMSTRRRRP
jgi:PEP-CTERM motif